MSSVPPSRASGRPGNFLVALLRRGAPVIADMPADLPEQAVDPNPQPGWRRITAMAGSTDSFVTDSLLTRACRYVVLVPLAYRIFVVPVSFLAFAAGTPETALGAIGGLAALLVALNILAVVWVLRVPGFRYAVARTLLGLDAAVALAANLVVPLLAPPGHEAAATAVPWTYLIGSVALWTLVWGVPAGVLLTLLSVPLQVVMLVIGGPAGPGGSVLLGALDRTIMLVAALVTAMVGLCMVGLGTRLALGVGIRRGREWEHARHRRDVHDTVLQTLEAMALPVPGARTVADLERQLTELRGIARAQAMELRRGLDQPVDTAESGAGLGEDLAGLAAEMAREGLRARLVFSDLNPPDGPALSDVRRLAVRDAVREALRNTMKHAGTDEVVLRVEQRDGGIAVIARDHGEGFDEAERPPGFGISNSISARLAEVGGSSTIESRPGNGTRVTLWVPL